MKLCKHNCLTTIVNTVKQGGIIIYPTDTVWGVGCNAVDAAAVTKLRDLKHKPADSPLIWLLPSITAVEKFCGTVTPWERKLLGQKHTTVIIHGQAVRVIKNGWLNKLLQQCGVPLIGTSANLHGQPTIASWHQAVTVFGHQDVLIVKGRHIYHHLPSRVVQVVDGELKTIRDLKKQINHGRPA